MASRASHVRGALLLHPIGFALRAGERTAITGPSGSGKSVLLRTLALLDACDNGYVTWRGERIARARISAYRRQVAYIAQRPAMLDGTVEDNLRYPYSLAAYRDVRFDRDAALRFAQAAGRADDFSTSSRAICPAAKRRSPRWSACCNSCRTCCCSTNPRRRSIRCPRARSKRWSRASSTPPPMRRPVRPAPASGYRTITSRPAAPRRGA